MLPARLYFILCLGVAVLLGAGVVLTPNTPASSSHASQYDSQLHSGYYILLNPDHSVQVYQGEKDSFTGTWQISNGKLFLAGSYFTFVLTIQGNTLIDSTNESWIKK